MISDILFEPCEDANRQGVEVWRSNGVERLGNGHYEIDVVYEGRRKFYSCSFIGINRNIKISDSGTSLKNAIKICKNHVKRAKDTLDDIAVAPPLMFRV